MENQVIELDIPGNGEENPENVNTEIQNDGTYEIPNENEENDNANDSQNVENSNNSNSDEETNNNVLNEDGTFKIPGEESLKDIQEVKSLKEYEGTFKDVAKDILGEEFENDFSDYKEFISKAKEKINSKIEQEKNSVLNNPIEALKVIDPELASLYEFKKEGGNPKNFYNSFYEIDNYLSLQNEQLVKEDFKALVGSDGERLFTDEEIESKINTLLENGQLDVKAKSIKESLLNARYEIENNIIAEQKQISAMKAQQEQEKIDSKANELSKILSGTNEFLGGKIEQKHKEYIVNQYKQKHRELMENPQLLADFMLYNTFGKQAIKMMQGKEFNKGKEVIKRELHNVPPRIESGTQSSGLSPKGFDAWSAPMNGEIEVEFKN